MGAQAYGHALGQDFSFWPSRSALVHFQCVWPLAAQGQGTCMRKYWVSSQILLLLIPSIKTTPIKKQNAALHECKCERLCSTSVASTLFLMALASAIGEPFSVVSVAVMTDYHQPG